MKKLFGVICLYCILLLGGCAYNEKEADFAEGHFTIYELNMDETKILSHDFQTSEEDTKKLVELLLEELRAVPKAVDSKAALSMDVIVNGFQISDETITIDFGKNYHNLSNNAEVLSRAAIVKTLTQIKGIQYVLFTINGSALTYDTGVLVGTMTAGQFLDGSSSNEEGTGEFVNLTLYFADETGTKLVPINRKVAYSSSVALEKLVVEQLIDGVLEEESAEEVYSVIDPETKVISVMVSDGTCYVNLDSCFLSQTYEASAQVMLYSIVNSLAELKDINKVQLLINGNSDMVFMETMPLSEVYERNLELVKEK